MATPEGSSRPANKLVAIKNALHDFLHEKNSFTHIFELVEKYTKVQREYVFLGGGFVAYLATHFLVIRLLLFVNYLGILSFLGLYLVVGYGAGLIVNLIGFVYPAYMS